MTRQLHRLTLACLAAFGLLALASGYWAIARQAALLTRADNPRRALLERRFPRGPIFDRNGTPLAESRGTLGDYTRVYPYPALAPVLGYASPFYGGAGVEAAEDDVLHGATGEDSWAARWREMTGAPPIPGAVRLTLDLPLQRFADEALGDRAGAVVLLDPASGEIWALASHPTFDPNTLDDHWSRLVADPQAPLLNRATFALYQPGGALAPALVAAGLQAQITNLKTAWPVTADLKQSCRVAPMTATITLAEAVQDGCAQPLAELGVRLGPQRLEQLLTDLRLLAAPQIGLPTDAAERPDFNDTARLATGQGTFTLTPLHLALVTAAFTQRGQLPVPRLLQAVQTPDAGWQTEPALAHPVAALAPEVAGQVKELLRSGYTATAAAGAQGRTLAWFTGFAPFETPRFVVAVLLEDGDAATAAHIGQILLAQATGP